MSDTRTDQSSEIAGGALVSAASVADARIPLERASTLPAAAFTSPAVYARESERLFRREWLCVGRLDQVPEPGDYQSLDLLGARLVMVRDDRGDVRVLSRVCRHRAAELTRGAGRTRSFQCPYHAWTYGLDGRLIGAPHMEGAEGFDRARHGLPEMRSEVWEGWVFVNFDDAARPLGPRLCALSRLLDRYDLANAVARETATFESRFNWKVLVDNFMESYHHIGTHRDTLEPMFPGARSYTPDNEGPYSTLFMPSADSGQETDGEAGFEGLVAAVVFPFHLFAMTDESLAWYLVLPESFERFTLRIYTCFRRETLADEAQSESVEALHALTRAIHEQDIGACEAVWAGLCSGSFESGRLSPLEKPIWQFNQWWAERMVDDAGALGENRR